MKLLNSYVSPFAARVRLAVYAGDLPVEIAPSGQWLPNWDKSPDFLAINPVGRVPTLVLDDGTALPESGVIVEYLAAAFPESRLLPSDPQEAARARLLAQLMELYVQPRAGPLFPLLFAPKRDAATIESCVAGMDEGLGYLEHFIGEADAAANRGLTIADCALAPTLFFYAERMMIALAMPSLLEKRRKLMAYWEAVQAAPFVDRILSEMRTAIAGSRLKMLMD